MPKVRKITGNYQQLLDKMSSGASINVGNFSADSKDITGDLVKDLNRDAFFPTNGMTYDDHVSTWMAPTTSRAYSQGNITASFYKLILNFFVFLNPKFELSKQPRGILPRTKETRLMAYAQQRQDWSFAYYDDYGIPCAVSIAYSTLDPSLWTAAIIRNTVAEPKDREVLLISPEDLLELQAEGLTNGKDAAHAFLEFLRSAALKKILADQVFLANGEVSLKKLNGMQTEYPFILPQEAENRIAKLAEQERIIKTWNLNSKQIAVAERAIKAQQQHQLQKVESWYSSWREKRLRDMHQPKFDAAIEQSFLNRHAVSASVAILSIVTLIGMALLLSGVLAPLGFAVISATAVIASFVVASAAAVTLVGSGIKMGLDQKALSDYQEQLDVAPALLEHIYQRKLQEIGVHQEVPLDAEQLRRTVLAADFSEEDFATLQADLEAAKEPVLVDELESEFSAAAANLEQVLDSDRSLIAQAERAVSHVDALQSAPASGSASLRKESDEGFQPPAKGR